MIGERPGLSGGSKKILFLTIGAVLVLTLAGVLGFMLVQKKDEGKATDKLNPKISQEDAKVVAERIIGKVGKLYDIPKDEEPTVAAVQDRAKLDGQTFFAKAKEGDYLLLFSKAELAMIYRESTNQLINVGPISLNEGENGATPPKQ